MKPHLFHQMGVLQASKEHPDIAVSPKLEKAYIEVYDYRRGEYSQIKKNCIAFKCGIYIAPDEVLSAFRETIKSMK